MDRAEISQCYRVHPEKKPRVDVETLQHSSTQTTSVSKVLDDDNLLTEIIVRVGLPNTLVCVALVCKRWLGHASDRKFLSRFRKLHPPRLLGCYITEVSYSSLELYATHFVPMLPQPPELAAIIRRLESYDFGTHKIIYCRNGGVFTECYDGTGLTHGAHRPLCADTDMQIVPPLPNLQDCKFPSISAILSKDEGGGLSYLYLMGESTGEAKKSTTRVYMLQDGVWRMHTLATCLHTLHCGSRALVIDNKIYVPAASSDDIIVLDLTTSTFSTVRLPQGVKYHYCNCMLSRADDASSVYLIQVKEFQLCIWIHKEDNWLSVDVICLHEMLAVLGISDYPLEEVDLDNVHISQVGDNGQFVFLRMAQRIFCLDIKCKTLCKVYEKAVNNRHLIDVHPFMMMWPPTFPALKDDCARKL